eukprot:CAMPEP_0202897252 /NCGR_PEP_ID=MMETSP1392-20130828/6067_1 /ASSEMBLY_ACC=CAM_ASM_000868 /TAXON_ID=225041 /ORGANISM="Chlamydomonas chlamydogama, Strain SAG 11-48b" /LENGTH=130 /DNA_ID=CAMNT_0049582849 /DNA_START=1364 /DNA_END=1752 /DNA_ORIENTATION=+
MTSAWQHVPLRSLHAHDFRPPPTHVNVLHREGSASHVTRRAPPRGSAPDPPTHQVPCRPQGQQDATCLVSLSLTPDGAGKQQRLHMPTPMPSFTHAHAQGRRARQEACLAWAAFLHPRSLPDLPPPTCHA